MGHRYWLMAAAIIAVLAMTPVAESSYSVTHIEATGTACDGGGGGGLD
jgi:hypothetical protein